MQRASNIPDQLVSSSSTFALQGSCKAGQLQGRAAALPALLLKLMHKSVAIAFLIRNHDYSDPFLVLSPYPDPAMHDGHMLQSYAPRLYAYLARMLRGGFTCETCQRST